MRIAFIGLGAMGQGIIQHVARAGHDIRAWNRTPERLQAIDWLAGVTAVSTVAEAAADADLAITMLADDPAVRAVTWRQGQLLASLPKDAIHVSMSTISTTLAAELEDAHADAGQHFVSAPVFGRPDAAVAGKLVIVAGGPPAAIERCRPVLEAIGQKLFVVGQEPSMANAVKLGGNFLLACMLESLGEAFALMRKSGVAPEQFLEIVNSHLFKSPVLENYGGIITGRRFDPAGFRLELGLKDARLVLYAAEQAQVPMPLASVVRDRLLAAAARGKGELDWAALAQAAAEDAGLA
jgi:3-hydroxyisobutyrate dehydrogenase-like beta-hydroxyacid dehydrogenase